MTQTNTSMPVKILPVCRGRLAPSPTGLLHLGNAWSFWMAWMDVRSRGGHLILRLEDIDPDRSKDEFALAVRRDLLWLGLSWDEEARPQSHRREAYEKALKKLYDQGLIYPCFCTRKELRAMAGAPQAGDAGVPYLGTCRHLSEKKLAEKMARQKHQAAWRLKCPTQEVWTFQDRVLGPVSMTLDECGGDFPLCRSDGVFAYQLAVVIDDQDAGITTIVRGADILPSTPRQLYLYSLFGARKPEYAHVPLILDHEGERLAKRHSSLSLDHLREAGVRPEIIFGWLAFLAGLKPYFAPLAADELLDDFDFSRLSPQPIRLPEAPLNHLKTLSKLHNRCRKA